MDYQEYRLKSICDIKSGKRIPKGMDFTNEITKYPYIRARDIKGGKIKTDDLIYIDETVHKKIKKYIINSGDIAITIVGASIGDVSYAQKEVDGYNLTENAVRLTSFTKDVNGKYLFYVLSQKQYNEYMQCVAGGAAQPKLGIYKIEPMKVLLPSIDLQNRVVDILSVYDEVIEINNKRIKILEQMAENIYKEWFVRFRFPGHEKVEFVDGVPKGWNTCKLKDIIEFNPTYSFMKNGQYINIPMAALSTTGMAIDETQITIENSCSGTHFKNGDVLFAKITPCLENGKTGLVYCLNKDEVGTGSTEFIVMHGVKVNSFYTYCIARNELFRKLAINSMNGADGRQRADLSFIKNRKWILPDDELLKRFKDITDKVVDQIDLLMHKNQNLIKQRDLLLPRLMSGKLKIG